MVVPMQIALAQTNSTAGNLCDPVFVDRNEYNRQQAAPGLQVTTKAFGIGRRFPIAQRFYE